MKFKVFYIILIIGYFFTLQVFDPKIILADCDGVELSPFGGGIAVCNTVECSLMTSGSTTLMCGGSAVTYKGRCSGTCTVGGSCDWAKATCNFTGGCGNNTWGFSCGGGGGGAGMSVDQKWTNIWVRALERVNGSTPIAWKGAQSNDPVWQPTVVPPDTVVTGDSDPPISTYWSVPIINGGGLDGSGQFNRYWTHAQLDPWDAGYPYVKTWDLNRNKIDNVMNIIPNNIKAPINDERTDSGPAQEYWSNHYCIGGIATRGSADGKWIEIYEDGRYCRYATKNSGAKRWCRTDVDGCWTVGTNDDSSPDWGNQLNGLVGDILSPSASGRIRPADVDWMDLRNYDEYWTMYYAGRGFNTDGTSIKDSNIRFNPPQGYRCVGARRFRQNYNNPEVLPGMDSAGNKVMDLTFDAITGGCMLSNMQYQGGGELIVFEVEKACERPKLAAGSACGVNGNSVTLNWTQPTGCPVEAYSVVMDKNPSEVPNSLHIGNNVIGPEDFMRLQMGAGNTNLMTPIYPDTNYRVFVQTCTAEDLAGGDGAICKGIPLAFDFMCPGVVAPPVWNMQANVQCLNGNVPTIPLNTKMNLSNSTGVTSSQNFSGSSAEINNFTGDLSEVYTLSVVDTLGNEYPAINYPGLPNVVSRSGDSLIWNASGLQDGNHVFTYNAPIEWCIVALEQVVTPKVDCLSEDLAVYEQLKVKYQLIDSLGNLVSDSLELTYSNYQCPLKLPLKYFPGDKLSMSIYDVNTDALVGVTTELIPTDEVYPFVVNVELEELEIKKYCGPVVNTEPTSYCLNRIHNGTLSR